MWLNLSAATPPTLTGTVHLDLLTFQAHKRPRNKAHTKLTKSVKVTQAFYQSENSIFGSCKNLNLVQFLISSSMLPLSLHSVRESRNVVSLLMQPKTDCLFFSSHFIHKKQPVRDNLGDMWSPETLAYNQTQEPQCPDSAATTTDSCRDSILSKKHSAAIYSNDLLYNDDHCGPFSFPADFCKGGATFQCIILPWKKQHV